MKYKLLGALVVLAIAAYAGLQVIDRAGAGNEMPGGPVAPAASKPTYSAVASALIDVRGGVTEISANLDGVISEVLVSEGDVVKVGDVLARQESGAEEIALKTAKMELESIRARDELNRLRIRSAERDIEELTPLYDIGAITKREFDLANDELMRARVQKKIDEVAMLKAESLLREAEFTLAQRTIRSTADGTVMKVSATAGLGASTLNVTSLFTVVPTDVQVVRAEFSAADIAKLDVGQTAEIYEFSNRETAHSAQVVHISKLIKRDASATATGTESDKQTVDVLLELDARPFMIGQKVQVRVLEADGESS